MENSKTLAVRATDRTATGQLQAIAATAPTHIIETLMDQEQSPSTACLQIEGQRCGPSVQRHAVSFILNLPNQPIGREDPTYSKLLLRIFGIAMAHGIHKCLMQAQFNALTGDVTSDRLDQHFQQWCELKG